MSVQDAVRESRAVRVTVVIAIGVALLDDAAYVGLIASQSSRAPDVFTVPFVAAFIALTAALLAISLMGTPIVIRLRPALRAGAAAGLLVLGVLGAFSIGAPLLLAGLIAAGVAIRSLVGGGVVAAASEVAAAAVVIALLVSGFEVTARLIYCPSDGSTMGGQWPGIVTHGFSWECVGGQVQFK